jgi:hypothetical protein
MNRVIISGASSNHFKSLTQFIGSVIKHSPQTTLIIYDLGLDVNEIAEINVLLSQIKKHEICTFNYSAYPSYFDINVNAGEYAWKPAIINEVASRYKNALLLWCDSGNILQNDLSELWKTINNNLIYSPVSSGDIKRWTHPLCLKWFNIYDYDTMMRSQNRNGAILGFNTQNKLVQVFLRQYIGCAKDKTCIAPEGSSRENHRQDQAVFTILYYKFVEKNKMPIVNQYIGLTIHNDID